MKIMAKLMVAVLVSLFLLTGPVFAEEDSGSADCNILCPDSCFCPPEEERRTTTKLIEFVGIWTATEDDCTHTVEVKLKPSYFDGGSNFSCKILSAESNKYANRVMNIVLDCGGGLVLVERWRIRNHGNNFVRSPAFDSGLDEYYRCSTN